MEKFYFPMRNMRVTQNYDETYSHKKHWFSSNNYADYPLDLAGRDGGIDPIYAPCKMRVTSIMGIKSSYTNTIWLESVNKVQTPKGALKVFLMLTHWNDNDTAIAKLKKGSIVNEGDIICYEGIDGANANHIHMVCGKGSANKLIKNSKGAWVSNGYCIKPEEIMYINREFTKEIWGGCLEWKTMPKVEYYDKPNYNGISFVDALKSINVDSSFSNRKIIANKNGISNYLGTGYQNKTLLELLKKGLLIK